MGINNLSEFEREFITQARRMWGGIVDKIIFKFEISERPPELAALIYAGNPLVVGSSLVRVPPKMTSAVKSKFFDMNFSDQKKVIIHEVGHIGIRNHGVKFREIVERFGGVVTLSQLEGSKYKLQKKVSSRFETIREFNTFEEAKKHGKIVLGRNPDTKLRVKF